MTEFCEIPGEMPSDETIRSILAESKTVAVVGISAKLERDSHRVAAYLQEEGYRIIPVNPTLEEVLGEKAYPSLDAIPDPVDVVDIFRKPEAVPDVVDEAIRIGTKAIWMQEGVVHNAAAEKARAAGIRVVMDRCMLKEHQRHDLS